MNFDSFSHGQIISKLWLCEQLEPHLPKKATVFILGSWYNLLGSMMLTRNRKLYQSILGIDIDSTAIDIADKLCETWIIEKKLCNKVGDASTYPLEGPNVIINCSPEHMENTNWLNNIVKGTLVCIQSSNMQNDNDIWDIKQHSPTIEDFISKYRLETILFCDTLQIRYENNKGYERFMMIGRK
jgi:hypothetical protein